VLALKARSFFRALQCDKLILSSSTTVETLEASAQEAEVLLSAIPAIALPVSKDGLRSRGEKSPSA
jgi:hypothetical protein